MKNFRSILAVAALATVACAPKAGISGNLKDAPGHEIEVRELNVNTWNILDTVKTNASGSFSFKVPVEKGQPEFIYLFHNGRKIASLLVKDGDKIRVEADTLGNSSVEGSEDSRLLSENERKFAEFAGEMKRLDDMGGQGPEMAKAFIAHYRENVRFVLSHPYSLVNVPLLYEQLNEYTPIFNQNTDAVLFRQACDSLKTVYPESRYVKALEKETVRREKILGLQSRLSTTEVSSFPDLMLPSIKGGEPVSLAGLDAKAVIVHFWDPSDNEQKMFNMDVLMPLYERWHGRGLEIYSVGVSSDKPAWAAVVNAQKLPWINVCDGQGAVSQALALYNVSSLPTSVLVTDEDGVKDISGVPALEKTLAGILR